MGEKGEKMKSLPRRESNDDGRDSVECGCGDPRTRRVEI